MRKEIIWLFLATNGKVGSHRKWSVLIGNGHAAHELACLPTKKEASHVLVRLKQALDGASIDSTLSVIRQLLVEAGIPVL